MKASTAPHSNKYAPILAAVAKSTANKLTMFATSINTRNANIPNIAFTYFPSVVYAAFFAVARFASDAAALTIAFISQEAKRFNA